MRIHEGDFAYDLEPVRNEATQLPKGWRYRIFCMHPVETELARGETLTRDEAEQKAHEQMAHFIKKSGKCAA